MPVSTRFWSAIARAIWAFRPYRPQHRGLADDARPVARAAAPPWPPAPPPAVYQDRLWLMAARYRPEPPERLSEPRVAAGRLTRVEVIRTYFELADRPVVAALLAAGWPTGYPLAFASEVTHL